MIPRDLNLLHLVTWDEILDTSDVCFVAGISDFEMWMNHELPMDPNIDMDEQGHFLVHSAKNRTCPELLDSPQIVTFELRTDNYTWYWCPYCFDHLPFIHD